MKNVKISQFTRIVFLSCGVKNIRDILGWCLPWGYFDVKVGICLGNIPMFKEVEAGFCLGDILVVLKGLGISSHMGTGGQSKITCLADVCYAVISETRFMCK